MYIKSSCTLYYKNTLVEVEFSPAEEDGFQKDKAFFKFVVVRERRHSGAVNVERDILGTNDETLSVHVRFSGICRADNLLHSSVSGHHENEWQV